MYVRQISDVIGGSLSITCRRQDIILHTNIASILFRDSELFIIPLSASIHFEYTVYVFFFMLLVVSSSPHFLGYNFYGYIR